MMQKRYQTKVHIGNWLEEQNLNNFALEQFKEAYSRGDTLLQKLDNIAANYLSPVELSTDPVIRFGSVVQLVPSQIRLNPHCKGYKPALSIAPDYNTIKKNQNINQNIEVTIAPIKEACMRSSFVIKSPDPNSCDNRPLKYAEKFVLQSVGPGEPTLVCSPNCQNLRNLIPPYKCFVSECDKLPLGICYRSNTGEFTSYPTGHSFWQCYHVDENIRFEMEGEPVPANTELIIVHKVTKKKLAAENVQIFTIFGKECLVNVYNPYTNSKQIPWNNVWILHNNSKSV